MNKEIPLTWDGIVVGTAELWDDGTVEGWIAYDTPNGEKALAALNEGILRGISLQLPPEEVKLV